MTRADLDELLALAVELGRRAATIHREGRRHPLQVRTKTSVTDLVSVVDGQAERAVVEAIRSARPDDAILAEEGTDLAGTTGVRWIVDPLDGTANYVTGYPAYAASIGVELDGELVAGAIVDTVRDAVYAARRGGGATLDGRPIGSSRRDDLSRCLIATGFHYDPARKAEQAQTIARLLPRIGDVRRSGSAALDLASVAAGEVDAYFEIDLRPWDVAAGAAIATEAGARVDRFPVEGWAEELVLAAPPQLFDPLRSSLVEAGVRLAS